MGHINMRQRPHWNPRTRIWNIQGLINEPALRHLGIFIENLIGCILVPVLGLRGIGVWDAADIHPVFGLPVLGVVNFGGGIDRGSEIIENATTLEAFTIDQDIIGVVGAGRGSIRVCEHVTVKLTVERACRD
jgi:hypothetical protein